MHFYVGLIISWYLNNTQYSDLRGKDPSKDIIHLVIGDMLASRLIDDILKNVKERAFQTFINGVSNCEFQYKYNFFIRFNKDTTILEQTLHKQRNKAKSTRSMFITKKTTFELKIVKLKIVY